METLNVYNNTQLIGTVTKTDNKTYIYEPKESVFNFPRRRMERTSLAGCTLNRIPDPNVPNIKEILKELNLKEYDPWEILKATKGIKYSDHLRYEKGEFHEPEEEENEI